MDVRSVRTRTVLMFLGAVLAAATLHAQQPAPTPSARPAQPPATTGAPTAAQEGFVPVEQLPEPKDRIPAPALVGTAYAFVWLALFTYIWSVWRRLGTVERELEAVSRRVTGGRQS